MRDVDGVAYDEAEIIRLPALRKGHLLKVPMWWAAMRMQTFLTLATRRQRSIFIQHGHSGFVLLPYPLIPPQRRAHAFGDRRKRRLKRSR